MASLHGTGTTDLLLQFVGALTLVCSRSHSVPAGQPLRTCCAETAKVKHSIVVLIQFRADCSSGHLVGGRLLSVLEDAQARRYGAMGTAAGVVVPLEGNEFLLNMSQGEKGCVVMW